MRRRELLKSVAAGAAAGVLAGLPRIAWASTGSDGARWRTFEVVTRVEVADPTGPTRVWLPMPLAVDTDYQKGLGHAWTGNGTAARIYRDDKYGAAIFYAEFPAGETAPVVEVTSRFAARDRLVDVTKPGLNPAPEDRATLNRYRESTKLIRTDGIVKKTSQQITTGQDRDVDKARAIYEWIVDNTFRDPKVRGCGVGDIRAMLETGNLGGKCADLNALFVGLVRAAGIPARDVYGVRAADSAEFKSLGKGGDITKAQHCRAEFYVASHGWVPVDPADVRKVVLEERGGIPLTDPTTRKARAKLFGQWEMNWLAYNYAHDVKLRNSKDEPVAYLMYPQAETGETRRDSLDPDSFKYKITSRELGI
ncbi:MAG TPA: transglutaminase domain-containing protein [Methylomirabilota bacterium]|nr:transglutaminase domain-containing protein [Methylomirabilota bacterium]